MGNGRVGIDMDVTTRDDVGAKPRAGHRHGSWSEVHVRADAGERVDEHRCKEALAREPRVARGPHRRISYGHDVLRIHRFEHRGWSENFDAATRHGLVLLAAVGNEAQYVESWNHGVDRLNDIQHLAPVAARSDDHETPKGQLAMAS